MLLPRDAPKSTEPTNPTDMSIQMDAFKPVLEEIKTARPEITDETLLCDQQVIAASLPMAKDIYVKRGFDESETNAAVSQAWKIVRLQSPLSISKCMARTNFVVLLGEMGKLSFTTTPNEASIAIDGGDTGDVTDSKRWLKEGKHTIRYSKDGYEPAEIPCMASSKVTETVCHADLKSKP